MYSSIEFNKLLSLIPRKFFNKKILEYSGDKGCYRFNSWNHLVSMIYAQLNNCKSLREVVSSFNHQDRYHYHIGIKNKLSRSTFSDSNNKRDNRIFLDLAKELINNCHHKRPKALDDFLYILDSSPIQLRGYGYDNWNKEGNTRNIQGLKLHLNYCFNDSSINDFLLTRANVNDITVGRKFEILPNIIYCFDKGYYDYNWWYEIDKAGSKFVTRQKNNSAISILKVEQVSKEEQEAGIISNELIKLTNRNPRGGKKNHYYGKLLRRVEVKLKNRNTTITLLSNALDYSAIKIADIYKSRWSIELCFKWLKQNLKIKSFIGHNDNAIKIQIYCAIITYLLLWIAKAKLLYQGSLRELLIYIRANLFQRTYTLYYLYRKRQCKQENNNQKQLQFIGI